MKINIERKDLLSALQKVFAVANSKTMAILSTVLLEAKGDTLKLTATNLDIGINCKIPAKVTEEGLIAVPAKRLLDIIKALPEGSFSIGTTKNKSLTINTKTYSSRISGLPPEDFPNTPEFKKETTISLKQNELKELLNLTLFAVAQAETRYTLTGVLFEVAEDKLLLVSTDGKKVAIAKHKLEKSIEGEIKTIIPAKALNEVLKNLNSDDEIKISFGNNLVQFLIGDLTILTRIIEGEFPNYKQVIPPVSSNKVTVKRGPFIDMITRGSLISTPDYSALKFEANKDKIIVSKQVPEIGESSETLEAVYASANIAIGFNPDYLLDALKAMDQETIDLEIEAPDKPGVIRTENYVYIALPMSIK